MSEEAVGAIALSVDGLDYDFSSSYSSQRVIGNPDNES